MNNPIPPKANRFFRISAWSFAIAASLLVIFYLGFNEFSRLNMQALNQKIYSSLEFEGYMEKILLKPGYAPKSGGETSPVHFQVDLGALVPEGEATLVLIASDAVGSELIYRGPYQRDFTIQADARLLGANGGNGADNFTVTIIQKENKKTGTGVIESIRPWQANKTVRIQLLPFREVNKLGLPETFKVEVS